MTHLSPAQLRVLELLEGCPEPVSITHLSEQSGYHPNTLREHLQALAEAGLVRAVSKPAGGRGRPPLLYETVSPDRVRPQDRVYGLLTAALAEHIDRTSPDPAAEALESGRLIGRRLAADGELTGLADESAEGALTRVLDHLGFSPVAIDGGAELSVCPFIRVATRTPQVICSVHRGLLEGWFEETDQPAVPVLRVFSAEHGCQVGLIPRETD